MTTPLFSKPIEKYSRVFLHLVNTQKHLKLVQIVLLCRSTQLKIVNCLLCAYPVSTQRLLKIFWIMNCGK